MLGVGHRGERKIETVEYKTVHYLESSDTLRQQCHNIFFFIHSCMFEAVYFRWIMLHLYNGCSVREEAYSSVESLRGEEPRG